MKLTFERQFLLAGHALALVGVAALATTHEVGPVYLLVAAAGLAASFWGEWRRGGIGISAQAANVAMFAALALIIVPVVGGASPVRAIGEFLLVLTALKGAARKENRDWLQIYVLSFFQLLAAAALTVEPVFALVFLAYLLLAPCVLALLLLRREVGESAGAWRLAEEPFVELSLFRSLATTTVVLFVSTLLIFIVFPRMGAGYFAAPFVGGTPLTGFSEEVGLGGLAALKQDEAVALRVTVDRPEAFAGARWRGAALDHFDGRTWRRRPQEVRPMLKRGPHSFAATERVPPVSIVREEVILEPQDSSAIFTFGRVLEIDGPFSDLSIDRLDNLRVQRLTGIRSRYEVLASLAPRRTPPTPELTALPPIDPRIVELARAKVSGLAPPKARAEALLAHFQSGFHYSLEPGDSGGADPLAHFLFESHTGFCEHFASAYAVMLRAVGIPSVVVNGYGPGEWNPYGSYFLIRQSDAHSWVEAYVDGEWRTFDPTPAGPPHEQGLNRRLAEMADALATRWYRYVINYTLEDQAAAALSLRDASRRLWEGLASDWWRGGSDDEREAGARSVSGRSTVVALAVIIALVAWLWNGRRRRERLSKGTLSAATERYMRLLALLAKRGLEKGPAETPEEFCRRVAGDSHHRVAREASARIARITALYQEARFSGREPPVGDLDAEIDSLQASLSADAGRLGAEARG